MRIEVSLSPALYPFRTIKEHHATVAIDLLRATTAVCAAFQAGCSSVLPLDTLEGIGQFRRQGFFVAAERGGSKVGDAEYGNSPTEYLRNDMTGIKLAYSTTNGTVSILRAADADLTLVASFANLSALCDRLSRENMDVVLLCSGWQNDFCIEDTLVAGAIIEKLRSLTAELVIANDQHGPRPLASGQGRPVRILPALHTCAPALRSWCRCRRKFRLPAGHLSCGPGP